jgi:hypothetical protein
MKPFFVLCFFCFLVLKQVFSFEYVNAYEDSAVVISPKLKKEAFALMEGGKKMYEEGKYRLALIEFKTASQKDITNHFNLYWLALTHYKLNNFGYALQYARQAAKLSKQTNFDYLVLLGKCYHQNKVVDSAKFYYQLVDSLAKPKQKKGMFLSEQIASCDFYKKELDTLKKQTKRVRIESEDINSGFNDYAPILIKEGKEMYFTSRRENTTGGRNNPDDEQYFEDNYRAVWNEQSKTWDSISNNLERINSQGFDCISYLTSDGLKGLMTLNNTAVVDKESTKSSDICEITFSNKGKWQSPKLIDNKSINSDFFDGSASMTADGTTMYFVTDRKADKSLTDIYVVKKEGNKWGEAKPVSDSINTPFRETTPFITPDGRFLFFSSDGHLGFGGYDIFVSENIGENLWTKPVNLGLEVNSVNDDTHFQYYPKLKKAMLVSFVIENLKGNMDIFELDLNNYQIPKTIK